MLDAAEGNAAVPFSQVTLIGEISSDNDGRVILSPGVTSRAGIKPNTKIKVLRVGGQTVLVDAAVYAVSKVRAKTKGAAERLGLKTEEDVYEFLNALNEEDRNP